MSLVGNALSWGAKAVSNNVGKIAMLAADFSPIVALISSLFTIFIMLAILKKFDKI